MRDCGPCVPKSAVAKNLNRVQYGYIHEKYYCKTEHKAVQRMFERGKAGYTEKGY